MKFTTAALMLAVCLSDFSGSKANTASNTTTSGKSKASSILPWTTLDELYVGVPSATSNLTIFAAVVKIAFGEEYLTSPFSVGTAFAPTDAAFMNTLNTMGVPLAYLSTVPQLVKGLLQYHISATVYPTLDSLKAFKTVTTGIMGLTLTASTSAGSTDVTVEAGQTYARILQGPLVMNKGAAALYVVDNVLLPPQAAMDMLLSSTTASTTPAPDKSVATPSPSSGPAIAPTAHSSAASSTFSWAALVGMLLATLL